jgi:hypothetical protein
MLRGISLTLQKAHGFTTTEAVTFRQLSANAATYRDAVEFKNGVTVRLQELEEGQSVEVLALSSERQVLGREHSSLPMPNAENTRRATRRFAHNL